MRWIKTLVLSFGGGLSLGLLIVLGLSLGIGGNTPQTAAARNILWRQDAIAPVQASGFSFSPNTVNINVGDTVSWTINGFHSVTAVDSSFNKPPASYTNEVFTQTFNSTGVFSYFCSIHGAANGTGMFGTIIVSNGAGETATPTTTNTPTDTSTPTITPTPTDTSTPTITPSPTTTPTPTATPSPVITGVNALKDTAIFSESGDLSNGAGPIIVVGKNQQGNIRRSLIAFDLSSIPVGSTVLSASLQMSAPGDTNGPQNITLHKASADWGTAGSNTNQGNGAPAQAGDTTWTHRFYSTTLWTTQGGDFTASGSATTTINGSGRFTWANNAALVADVQSWVNAPSNNFGWVLVGNETLTQTAKRLASKENATLSDRPILNVQYIPAATPTSTCLRFNVAFAKENDSTVTSASGNASFILDTQLNTLSYYMTYSYLSSTETNAHFHAFIPPATTGSPIAGQRLSANGSPKIGVWQYGSLPNAQAIEDALLAGHLYVNIHTANNPAGEIRANLINPAQCQQVHLPMLMKP